jgi:hypothetical protein
VNAGQDGLLGASSLRLDDADFRTVISSLKSMAKRSIQSALAAPIPRGKRKCCSRRSQLKHTGVVALLEAAGRTNNAESDGDGGELAQSK